MDLGLSEEQQMIQTSAREFLAEKSSKEVVRAMEEDDLGYPPELWKEMAGQGWMGMVFPEKYGGDGFSFLDLAVLLEEMGRNLTPSPFFSTVVLCGLPILEFGSDAQKDAHLKKIAGGDEIWVYAQTEPSATWEASGVELTAAKDGDGYSAQRGQAVHLLRRHRRPAPRRRPHQRGQGRGRHHALPRGRQEPRYLLRAAEDHRLRPPGRDHVRQRQSSPPPTCWARRTAAGRSCRRSPSGAPQASAPRWSAARRKCSK